MKTNLTKINPLDFTTALDCADSLDFSNLAPVALAGDDLMGDALGRFSISSAGDVTTND